MLVSFVPWDALGVVATSGVQPTPSRTRRASCAEIRTLACTRPGSTSSRTPSARSVTTSSMV
eukprot:5240219-Pyramimonas_sp.AAC.1